MKEHNIKLDLASADNDHPSSYLQQLKNELRQISWTSRADLITLSKIVLTAILLFGFSIYGVDLLIRFFLMSFKSFIHLIFR